MSNTINPYGASRPELQRPLQSIETEEDGQHSDVKKSDIGKSNNTLGKGATEKAGGHDKVDQASNQEHLSANDSSTQVAAKFGATLEGAIDRSDDGISKSGGPEGKEAKSLDGLSPAEHQLIHRYFPESPSLELRLYKPDMSTDKVDPGSVGSRVDIRG